MSINRTYQFPFAAYPAIRLGLLMAAGIIIDFYTNIQPFTWICLASIFMVLYVAGEYSNKNGIYSLAYNTLIICYLAFIIAFGAAWHSLFDYREIPSEAKVLNTYTWQELHFSGSVQQIIETGTGKYQLDVNIEKTVFPNNLTWTKSYKLRAVVNPDNLAFPEDMQLGSDISFLATVYPLEPKRNPAQFNYKQYLASKGIYSQVGILKIQRLKSPKSNILSWTYWRQIVLDAIKNNFHNRNASLAKALLVGYKNELDRKDKISFSRAGLSHIMAVSGLHVGFILVPFWIVMPFFWTFRFGKQIGLFILTGILFFYAGLTGFSASVTRASLGGGLLIYGRLFHKVRDPKNLAAVAALILLLLNPNELFDIGFQLSFGAVYIILLTIPVISRQLPNWIQYRWYGKPVMVVIISLIVQLGLFPLLAFYFEEFSLVGPLVNAFVIPLLGFVVPYALILIPVGIFLPGIAHTMNIPADIFMSWLNNLVHIITRWDWSWIQVHTSGILLLAIWTIAIFFIATLPIAKIRWKMLIIFLLLLGISQLESIVKKLEPATLDLLVFDVGQGDGMLITTPNRKHFLIDTGRWQPDYNSAKYVIIPYLKAKGIKKLDAVFLSHPHADHIGGLPELIKSIPIDTIYNSGASYNSQLFRRYHKLAAQHHIPIKSISAGIEVPLDSTMRIFTYGPETKAGNHNVNNYSLILELVYGKTEMLFMGDAEKSEEKKLIADYPKLANTDFLKVGHHGSKTSSTTTLLDDITPSQGVVSVAIKNRYHHPNAEAIRRLRRDSVKLHFTSMSGAIRVHSDGKDIWMDK